MEKRCSAVLLPGLEVKRQRMLLGNIPEVAQGKILRFGLIAAGWENWGTHWL
jgi:hypothetical protein